MTAFLIYLLKVSCCLVFCFGSYYFLLRNKSFFQLNRLYLVFSGAASLVIPFLKLNIAPLQTFSASPTSVALTQEVPYSTPPYLLTPQIETVLNTALPTFSISLGQVIFILYLTVASYLFFRLARRIYSIGQLKKQSIRRKIFGTSVLQHPKVPTSSFFNCIFWNEPDDQTSETLRAKLLHEQTHGKQRHSLDLLFFEILGIFQWFNPLMKRMLKELKMQHEFIADFQAKESTSLANYISILQRARSGVKMALPLTYFDSMISRRVKMMMKEPSKNHTIMHYVLLFPILTWITISFSNHTTQSELYEVIDQFSKSKIYFRGGQTPHYLRWGSAQIPLAKAIAGEGRYYLDEFPRKIKKGELLEILNQEMFLFIDDKKVSRSEESMIQLLLNFPKSVSSPGFHTGHITLQPPFVLNDSIQELVRTNLRDGSMLRIMSEVNGSYVFVMLTVEDFETKRKLIQLDGQSFSVWSNKPGSWVNPANFNIVSWKELVNLLQSDQINLVVDGVTYDRTRLHEHVIHQGPSILTNRFSLIQKLEIEKEISAPISISLAGPKGMVYYSTFDDEINPTITYDNWNDYAQEEFHRLPVEHKVLENIKFTWGPLDATNVFNYAQHKYFHSKSIFNPKVANADIAEGVKINDAKEILNSKPRLSINGKLVEGKLTIKLFYLDHEGLPVECDLEYDRDMNLATSPCRDDIIMQLKPDDFITINGIFFDNSLKYLQIPMKIKN